MKQYCRYCCHMAVGDVNYCSRHKKTVSDAAAKAVNRCSDFSYNSVDAFFENKKGYHSRTVKKTQCDGQLDLTSALRTECQVKDGYPCTYYVASRYRYQHEGKICDNTCCCGCGEKRLCGFACNASKE